MDISKDREELEAAEARLRELSVIEDERLSEDERAEFEGLFVRRGELVAIVEEFDAFVGRRESAAAALAEMPEEAIEMEEPKAFEAPAVNVRQGESPWDRQAIIDGGVEDFHGRALSAVEEMDVDDAAKAGLTYALERGEGQVPELVLATTSPAYRAAFAEYVRTGVFPQGEALQFAEPMRRAMSAGTNNAGGFLVPTDIEPSVTLSADGTSAPIYDLARKVQTTSSTYRVVTSDNAAWSWDGENTEVSDDTTTFANTDIALEFAQAFVPISIAGQQSIGGAMSVIGDVMRAGYMDLIGAATSTGTGSSQPTGIVTALTGSATASAATDTFAVGDVYALHQALGQRYRRNATFAAHINIINDIRQFATDDGHALLSRLADGTPGTLLGSRLVENPDMDGVINAAAENYVLVYGDFSHYVVAEGIGTLVEVIPHVFGSNGRPIGARGVYMATRFGADSVNDGAFAMLNVT